MKLSAPFLLVLAAIGVAEAASTHDAHHAARHHNIARKGTALSRRASSSRCKVRSSSTLASSTSSTHKTSSTKAAAAKTSSSKKPAATADNESVTSGLIRITDTTCNGPGAVASISATKGPNGDIDWFNCGVTGGGWEPPMVKVDEVVAVDLADALTDPSSPFLACKDYVSTFTKYANEHGIPPIVIASIAMQESSCDPSTVGGAGEQGLMQITKDKCVGAPGGNCKDIDFNIKTGTAYFASVLNDNGGSLLETIGNYNGWSKGMTYASATAAAFTSCCRCQNNLDYLQQMMNGWFQNYDPYTHHMGKYFNLDSC